MISLILLSVAALGAGSGYVIRRFKRDLKLKSLALAIEQGKVHVEMSDLTIPKGQTLNKGEVVGQVETGHNDAQLVFYAFSCPVTGKVNRVKFWIDDTRYEEEILSSRPDQQQYLGLAKALDKLLREMGKTPILPEERA